MRIVALQAVCAAERLILVRLLETFVFRIVARDAESRSRLRQVKQILRARLRTCFVGGVASVTAHVECRVTTAFRRNIRSLRVAGETKIVFLVARSRFQQLKLVVRRVRIMAGEAIADRGLMNMPLYLLCIFFRVAGQADFVWDGCDQLYSGDILVNANLMAAEATRRHCGVH